MADRIRIPAWLEKLGHQFFGAELEGKRRGLT
jgi:hypothetical protein